MERIEPVGSQLEGGMPADIELAVNCGKREPNRSLDGVASYPTTTG